MFVNCGKRGDRFLVSASALSSACLGYTCVLKVLRGDSFPKVAEALFSFQASGVSLEESGAAMAKAGTASDSEMRPIGLRTVARNSSQRLLLLFSGEAHACRRALSVNASLCYGLPDRLRQKAPGVLKTSTTFEARDSNTAASTPACSAGARSAGSRWHKPHESVPRKCRSSGSVVTVFVCLNLNEEHNTVGKQTRIFQRPFLQHTIHKTVQPLRRRTRNNCSICSQQVSAARQQAARRRCTNDGLAICDGRELLASRSVLFGGTMSSNLSGTEWEGCCSEDAQNSSGRAAAESCHRATRSASLSTIALAGNKRGTETGETERSARHLSGNGRECHRQSARAAGRLQRRKEGERRSAKTEAMPQDGVCSVKACKQKQLGASYRAILRSAASPLVEVPQRSTPGEDARCSQSRGKFEADLSKIREREYAEADPQVSLQRQNGQPERFVALDFFESNFLFST
ncbi:hypothetical protein cyc_06775 [Cyclospora cayetanensis]|uniref:Uncharacterized protein n=1 Tax=Cyclospora cayetanensis TaxID=88456 RepID=A0A1D3CUG9_9EIME|nr:hypothetical protein cyc_06775 [Cyclospora cayetanensis]